MGESFALCRLYYKENGLDAADPLPAGAMAVDRGQLDAELILCGMLNAIFVLAARDGVTEQMLALWTASAARAGMSGALTPWLTFVGDLFISNTVDAEKGSAGTIAVLAMAGRGVGQGRDRQRHPARRASDNS